MSNTLIKVASHRGAPDGTPIANLFLTFINACGAQAATFGDDGTGPLTL